MRSSILVLLSLPLIAPAAGASHPGAALDPSPLVQDDDEKPDKRADIAELIKKLEGHVKERGKEDMLAIEVIDQLLQEFPNCGPKDRESIIKALDKCLKAKRQELEDGTQDNRLYLASAIALGEMGEEAAKAIAGWIDHKTHRKNLDLQRRLILSLGKTKEEKKSVKLLVDLLSHHSATMQGAAAEALANYAHLPQKERKSIFEDMLQQLMGVYNAVQADAADTIARDRWNVIKAPMVATMHQLSRCTERDPNAIRDWWNDNKKEDWDEDDG